MTSPLGPVTTQVAHPASPGGKPPPSPQRIAALQQLVAKYSLDQSHNVPASTLATLGRQILSTAAQLGQYIRLPAGSSGPAPAQPAAAAAKGAVDVTG